MLKQSSLPCQIQHVVPGRGEKTGMQVTVIWKYKVRVKKIIFWEKSCKTMKKERI